MDNERLEEGYLVRWKPIDLDQMVESECGNKRVNPCLTRRSKKQLSMEVEI